MKINKNKLLNFIKYISLKGDIEITEAILDFKTQGLYCLAHKDGIVALRAVLKCDCDELGELGIDNLKFFKEGINLFNDEEINVELIKNKLVLDADNKKLKLKINLRNCEYILTKITGEEEGSIKNKFEKSLKESKVNLFTLSKEIREQIIKHYRSIKSEEVILEGKDNELSIKLENNENELIDSFEIEKVDSFKVKVSKFFIELLSLFGDDEVKISAVNEKPIYIDVSGEDGLLEYIVAPLK